MNKLTITHNEIDNLKSRISNSRMRIMLSAPFYGSMLLQIKFALANCKTAATDMQHIFFDPQFLSIISDEELDFVLMHEILHVALQHCARGKNYNQKIFNISCDIVVNSNILKSMNKSDFSVAGIPVAHRAPEGLEGYLYTAEELYALLIQHLNTSIEQLITNYTPFDSHSIWTTNPPTIYECESWKKTVCALEKSNYPDHLLPTGVRNIIEEFKKENQLSWKEILHDFITLSNDTSDYSYMPPDKRFSDSSFILPSFSFTPDWSINNIWFVLDASASMTDDQISMAYNEIQTAIAQFNSTEIKFSYFDTCVTEPITINKDTGITETKPPTGGGTSFHCIFDYLSQYMHEALPNSIIIMTDGYADFPDKSAALGIPVLWIIIDNPNCRVPWGTSIHL